LIDRDSQRPASLAHRLAWFIALWTAGVLVVAAVAWLIRLVLL
jgi:hypothetical protein